MGDETIHFPQPDRRGERTLEWVMDQRFSCRSFSSKALTTAQIGQLLWAAQGSNAHGGRTAPSAGARYPLEVYAVTAEGVGHYDPVGHRLLPGARGDIRQGLADAALAQSFVAQAPLTIVLCAIFARVTARYGRARGERYTLFEVGHAAQNVLLQAVALGLGSVAVGAYDDRAVHQVLGVAEDHVPLYLLPIGYPA